jgi:peptidoglycan hydrolase-like protein with peptidoglycan-binding domain
MKHNLTSSVGEGGVNRRDDVLVLQKRLLELGFHWIVPDGKAGPKTIATIRLFQAVFRGLDTIRIADLDGRIDVPGTTYRWLNATNAPQWGALPDGSKTDKSLGFFNFTKIVDGDKNFFGVNWLLDGLVQAGQHYAETFLSNNPGASVMYINNISKEMGGDLDPHQTHQTGINADILLPRKSGTSGNITWKSADYDRAATEAMLRSIKAKINLDFALFNDEELIAKGLCSRHRGHDNHIHIRLEPFARGPLLEA